MDDSPDFLYLLIGFMVLFVVAGSGVAVYDLFFKVDGSSSTRAAQTSTGEVTVKDDDHTRGSGDVTVVEYVDFQCPACQQMYPHLRKLVEEHGDKITLVTRHFPLDMHQNAMPAAFAAEAAAQVGGDKAFYEMENRLFSNQNEWKRAADPTSLFEQYAQDIGLDREAFNTAYASDAVRSDVRQEAKEGERKFGVRYTPFIMVNGEEYRPRSYRDFVQRIKQATQQ